jgi:hypothetical protein
MPGEEATSGAGIAAFGQQHIDDLAMLIGRRYRYVQRPATLTCVSSTNHQSRTAWRLGRAAAMKLGREGLHPR